MVGSKDAGVTRVMSFGISSRRYPSASFAAILAIGNPVAFDARAEDRETRGFISMATMRPSAGLMANWMFEPPVSTPTRRMIRFPASRIAWYSLSVNVSAGATVMESPVCTPIGSMFSMEQTTTKLSATSRMTSSSNSFQPITDSSISTSWTGLIVRPRRTTSWNSSMLYAMPAPTPPRVNDGRTMAGNPVAFTRSSASSRDRAYPLRGTSIPMSRMASRNFSRSSATSMASTEAPINSTPCRSSAPFLASAMARFNAV